MSITRYIFIPELTTLYNDKNYPEKMADAIRKAISQKYFLAYATLEQARDPKNSLFKRHFTNGGIIEVEVDDERELKSDYLLQRCRDILALPSNAQRAKQLSSFIKTVYVKGFDLPFTELDIKIREATQVASFNLDSVNDSTLQLTQPPFVYLKKIRKELLFLLFTDHHFFLNFENWRHYNSREPKGNGCMYDLFRATTKLCERLMTLSKTDILTMKEIQTLQTLLSESVFANSTVDKRGVFREGYNSFPLHHDAVTIDGIKELLVRIRSDKQAGGFRIGFLQQSLIVSSFCNVMSCSIREQKPWKKLSSEVDNELTPELLEELKRLEALAIEETARLKKIPMEEVEPIIHSFLQDFIPHKAVAKSNFWANLIYFYSDLSATHRWAPPKAEYQYDMRQSRKHAMASAGKTEPTAVNIQDCSDEELVILAKKIYDLIQLGESIYLFPPEPQLAEKWAHEALQRYNSAIPHAKSPREIIQLVDDLVHELEILHLFYDVNCRTNYLLMNFLFLRHAIKWAIEFNPNRLDAYSNKERVLQHTQAILRTDSLIEQQDKLLRYNARIDLIYLANIQGLQTVAYSPTELSTLEVDDQYQQLAQQLVDKLDEFERILQEVLILKIKKYALQPDSQSFSSTTPFFSIPPEYKNFARALKQFQLDYDARLFFESVAELTTITEIAEDIKTLKALTGFNDRWLLSETIPSPSKIFSTDPLHIQN